MVLVDTSVWIEFFKAKHPYFQDFSVLLADRQVLTTSCIFGELLQGARNKREEKILLEFWNDLPKVSLELFENSWINAGKTSSTERWYAKGVGLIDATILQISKTTGAKLWTLDKAMNKISEKWALRFEAASG